MSRNELSLWALALFRAYKETRYSDEATWFWWWWCDVMDALEDVT